MEFSNKTYLICRIIGMFIKGIFFLTETISNQENRENEKY
jgi:hypothetical protein